MLTGCKKEGLRQFDGEWIEDKNYAEGSLPGTMGGDPLTTKELKVRKLFEDMPPMRYKFESGKIFYPETMQRADAGIIQLEGRFMEVLMQFPRQGKGPEIGHMVMTFERRGDDLFLYDDPFSSADRKFTLMSEPVAGGDAAR